MTVLTEEYDLLCSPEFADNGSIHDYIHVTGHKPDVDRSVIWAQQIAEGVVVMTIH